MFVHPAPPARLPFPYRPEADVAGSASLPRLAGALDWAAAVHARARPGCRRCATSRRRSGPWKSCCASTRSPAPRAWP